MKYKNIFLICAAFTSFFFTGCALLGFGAQVASVAADVENAGRIAAKGKSARSTAVSYSFAENESETATITFMGEQQRGIDLFFYEGTELPFPEDKKYWRPIVFPAGRSFTLTVGVYNKDTERGKEVVFNCPALTAGKNYQLEGKKPFWGKINKLVLTEAGSKTVVYEQKM